MTADDHPVVRAGVGALLNQQDDIEVVGQAEDGEAAIKLYEELHPDVVLMDVHMPKVDGVTATERIVAQEDAKAHATKHANNSRSRVLILTTTDDEDSVLGAIEAGASGYILKGSTIEEILGAIRTVAAGESALAPAAAEALVRRLKHTREINIKLTTREMDVLRGVAMGLSNAEVGKRLYIGGATVKTHLEHIFNKLEVTDRTRAVTRAIELGIL